MEVHRSAPEARESNFPVGFIFSRIKKGEGQGKEKFHAKSMMSKETNERLKRDTQHVPLRNLIFLVFFVFRPLSVFVKGRA